MPQSIDSCIGRIAGHPTHIGYQYLSKAVHLVLQYGYPTRSLTIFLYPKISEETGATAAHYESLGQLYPSPGYCGEIIHLYLATGLSFGDMCPDDDEFLEVERIPLQQAVNMVLSGEIKDAKTQTAVLKVYVARQKQG